MEIRITEDFESPAFGTMKKGEVREVGDYFARIFIKRGLAEQARMEALKPTITEEEDGGK